jgi:co-chaperonin GroES (HSP10)
MKIHTPTECEQYEPIGDKVLLALPQEDVNALVKEKGILVPQDFSLKQTPLRETVVTAVGPDCVQVWPGDTVLWNKNNGGQPFPWGDKDLYFLDERNLICVLKKAADRPKERRRPCKCAGAPDEGTS